MSKYVIKGESKIEGSVEISGSKNSALPIIAACILNGDKNCLYNVPNIRDIDIMIEIMKNLGCVIKRNKEALLVDSSGVNKFRIDKKLMSKMRASVILAGPLIARFKNVEFSYPGGCEIGDRPIDLHIKSFKKLGINIDESTGYIVGKCDRIIASDIHLNFPSVGATENLIMASVFACGEVIIKNAAMEPEIVDLQNFLNKMGAKISGAGSSIIRISGMKKLKGVSYNIMPDRIETGTFLAYAAMTNGKIEVNKCNKEHINPVILKLQEAGCKIYLEKEQIQLISPKRLNSIDLQTAPFPGFPTDLQSIFLAMLVNAKGVSKITENVFENRFKCANELIKMGAKMLVLNSHCIVEGIKKLNGAKVCATDLRCGAALIGAGMKAKGITVIDNSELIERGYDNIIFKLNSLNIDIKKQRS